MNVLFWTVLIAFISFLWLVFQQPQWIGIQTSSIPKNTAYVSQNTPENKENLLQSTPVYAVQIGAFKHKDLSLYSEGFVNFRSYKNRSYNAYSLGNFDNYEEAEAFRKELIALGFKDPMVALFEDGQRILINTSELNE